MSKTSPLDDMMWSCWCFPHVSKMSPLRYQWENNVIIKNDIILNIISDYYYFYLFDALQFCCQSTYGGVHVAHYFSFLCCHVFCLSSSCVLCAQLWRFLWIVHSWLPPSVFSGVFFLNIFHPYYNYNMCHIICAFDLTIPVSCNFFCL